MSDESDTDNLNKISDELNDYFNTNIFKIDSPFKYDINLKKDIIVPLIKNLIKQDNNFLTLNLLSGNNINKNKYASDIVNLFSGVKNEIDKAIIYKKQFKEQEKEKSSEVEVKKIEKDIENYVPPKTLAKIENENFFDVELGNRTIPIIYAQADGHTKKTIQRSAGTNVRKTTPVKWGNISYANNRQEFCSKHNSSEATIYNIISKLKKIGVLVKDGVGVNDGVT
jgi:hypothetical protein